MPLNLSALGARELIDALTNPATAPRVAVAVRNAGISVAESFVVATSRTGSELRVRGYSADHTTPFPVDAFVLEYGPFSVRSGLAQTDVAFLPAAVGVYFELLFALAESASPPAVAAPGISAQEVLSAASAAVAAKDTVLLAKAATLALRDESIAARDAAVAANNAAQAVLTGSHSWTGAQTFLGAVDFSNATVTGLGGGDVMLAGEQTFTGKKHFGAGLEAGSGSYNSFAQAAQLGLPNNSVLNDGGGSVLRGGTNLYLGSNGMDQLSLGYGTAAAFGNWDFSNATVTGLSSSFDPQATWLSLGTDGNTYGILLGTSATDVWCYGSLNVSNSAPFTTLFAQWNYIGASGSGNTVFNGTVDFTNAYVVGLSGGGGGGGADMNANYTWTGSHVFNYDVSFQSRPSFNYGASIKVTNSHNFDVCYELAGNGMRFDYTGFYVGNGVYGGSALPQIQLRADNIHIGDGASQIAFRGAAPVPAPFAIDPNTATDLGSLKAYTNLLYIALLQQGLITDQMP